MNTARPEQHQRAAEVFEQVCDLPLEVRAARLRDLCASDQELHDAVTRLLAADASSPGPLDAPAFRVRLPAPLDELEPLPTQIGPFHIKSLLGRGGMGVVYLAEQPGPRREVALKVLRAGLASPKMLRRFEHEAEVLARLHHPGIAQVYEAGVHRPADPSAEPRPYFAMEVVLGKPITEHAAEHALDVRTRLELFARVCDAVHHAHAKGIIHRDLKPGNVLVDAGGQSKVLDFGVARITQGTGETTSLTMHTHVGQLIGTLQYMSPEQASGDPTDVDTRSDVYSMGLILYELLAGRPALQIPARPIEQAIRAIREQPPPRLATLAPACRGDIETIVAKAAHKDREQRYKSMADLAADLRRLLADQPIEARPPSARYELGKFVKRNRRLVAGAALALLLLLAATAGLTELWLRAARAESARRAAAAREEELRSVARSISGSFAALMDELAARSQNDNDFLQALPKMSAAFKNTAAMLADESVLTDLGTLSDFHRGMGQIFYYELGLPALGLKQYQLALELNKADTDPDRRDEDLKLGFFVGHAYLETQQFAEAEKAYRFVVDYSRATPERVPPLELAKALDAWSQALLGLKRYDDAVAALTEATVVTRKEKPAPSAELVDSLAELGDRLRRAKRDDEADSVYKEALDQCATLEKDRPGISLKTLRYQAKLEGSRKHPEEAERIQRDVLERSVALYGEIHRDVASAHVQLAGTLATKGDLAGAEDQLRRALHVVRNTKPPLPRNEAAVLDRLAEVLEKTQGRAEEAKAAREQAAKIWERVRGAPAGASP